ncbi:MAG: serine/threonine protein kinase [Pseudomonadota bacterium]
MTAPQNPEQQPYADLDPDTILDAVEAVELEPTGGITALNSYENRVYQIALEDGSFVIGKFYRPARLSDAAIEEEHTFTHELADAELSCVAPLRLRGRTLHSHKDYRFALFPRQGGHPPDIEIEENLKVLARTLARIHSVGRFGRFEHRGALSVERYAVASRTFLLESDFIPAELRPAYESTTEHLLERLSGLLDDAPMQRIHGDCHLGNLLWRDDTPHFIDFDDTLLGPPVQDLWMLLSGDRAEQQQQLDTIISAYEMFADLDLRSLSLIEPLRTLRIMYHAAWIGRRWQDPAFPPAFPWYDNGRYWSDHVLTLREQLAALDEPPLLS